MHAEAGMPIEGHAPDLVLWTTCRAIRSQGLARSPTAPGARRDAPRPGDGRRSPSGDLRHHCQRSRSSAPRQSVSPNGSPRFGPSWRPQTTPATPSWRQVTSEMARSSPLSGGGSIVGSWTSRPWGQDANGSLRVRPDPSGMRPAHLPTRHFRSHRTDAKTASTRSTTAWTRRLRYSLISTRFLRTVTPVAPGRHLTRVA